MLRSTNSLIGGIEMTKDDKVISIKVRLLGIILPVIIIIMLVLTGLSYYVSKKVIKADAHNLLQTSVESQAAAIEAWLNQNLVHYFFDTHILSRLFLTSIFPVKCFGC